MGKHQQSSTAVPSHRKGHGTPTTFFLSDCDPEYRQSPPQPQPSLQNTGQVLPYPYPSTAFPNISRPQTIYAYSRETSGFLSTRENPPSRNSFSSRFDTHTPPPLPADISNSRVVAASPSFSLTDSFSSLISSEYGSSSEEDFEGGQYDSDRDSNRDNDSGNTKRHDNVSSIKHNRLHCPATSFDSFWKEIKDPTSSDNHNHALGHGSPDLPSSPKPDSEGETGNTHRFPHYLSNSSAFSAAFGLREQKSSRANAYDSSLSPNTSPRTTQSFNIIHADDLNQGNVTPRSPIPEPRMSYPRPSSESSQSPPKSFTSTGLTLGKLKILVLGDPEGSQHVADSLCKSEHIVQVTQLEGPAVFERLASTKPKPGCMASSSQKFSTSSTLKNLDAADLEWNLSVLTSPSNATFEDTNMEILSYLQRTREKTLSILNPESSDTLSIMTHSQVLVEDGLVDLCIWVINVNDFAFTSDKDYRSLKQADREMMQKVQKHVGILPVLIANPESGRHDKRSTKRKASSNRLKRMVLESLQELGVEPLMFGSTLNDELTDIEDRLCDESFDESDSSMYSFLSDPSFRNSPRTCAKPAQIQKLLFPPLISTPFLGYEYSQIAPELRDPCFTNSHASTHSRTDPNPTSELDNLLQTILCVDGAAWLRHESSKRFLAWARHKTNVSSNHYSHYTTGGNSTNFKGDVMPLVDDRYRSIQAQAETSKWVTKLSESVFNQKETKTVSTHREDLNRITGHAHFSRGKSSSARDGGETRDLASSNTDPLNLFAASWQIFSFAFKAVTVIVGLKLGAQLCYFLFTSSTVPSDLQTTVAANTIQSAAAIAPSIPQNTEVTGPLLAAMARFADVVSEPSEMGVIRPRSLLGSLWTGELTNDSVGGFWGGIKNVWKLLIVNV